MRRLVLALAVAAPAMALYAGTVRYGPVWDDHAFVQDEPFLRECRNLAVVLNPSSLVSVLAVRNAARPAWLASVLVDRCLFGDAFSGLRVSSLFWHGAGALLLCLLAWKLTRDLRVAALAGLLFGVHPVHTEAVNVVTFRSDLLAFVFMTAAFLLYTSALERRGRAYGVRLALALGAFAAALLAKEMAVVLPLLLAAGDALVFSRRAPGLARRRAAAYVAFAAVLGAYLIFRAPRSGYVWAEHSDVFSQWRDKNPGLFAAVSLPSPDFASASSAPKAEPAPWIRDYLARVDVRVWTSSRILGDYLRLLFWPRPLQGDYAPRPVYDWREAGVLLAWALWLLVAAAAWGLRRRRPDLSFALFWLGATLLPVSGLVGLKNPQAERYLYIPSAGACLFLAGLARKGAGARRLRGAATAGCLLLAAAWSVWTVRRNRDYAGDEAFYRSVLAVDPEVPRARLNLALALSYEGRREEARREFERVLESSPDYVPARRHYDAFRRASAR